MDETDKPVPLYQYGGSEVTGGLQIVCPKCRMSGTVSMTVITRIPTEEGRFLGLIPERKIIHGGVSWREDHSGCSYTWNPQT